MKPTQAQAASMATRYSRIAGRAVNASEVEEVLASFDEVAAQTEEEGRYRTEVWDKQSPINGVPAADVLAGRQDIPEDGTVYLVYEGNQVLLFQPFIPGKEGIQRMTPAVANTEAGKHVKRLAADKVQARLDRHLEKGLNLPQEARGEADNIMARDAEVDRRVKEELARIEADVRRKVREDEAARIISEARNR